MTSRFGTDGIRGEADTELTDPLVYSFGRALARVFDAEHFVIGRDTRESGPRIERGLTAGLVAEGSRVDLLGVAPTPAVAFVCAADEVPGVVISASHNPYSDNGIKLFAADGRKLSEDVEARLDEELDRLLAEPVPDLTAAPTPDGVEQGDGGLERYTAAVTATLEGRRLDGLQVVVDCANGAASDVAPSVLRDLGADVTSLHASPDGRNINEGCGSTYPGELQRTVVSRGADVGLAFDGDADRVLAVDEHGNLVDGDQIIAMCAIDRRDRGLLAQDTVVVTVMANLGLRRGLADTAIKIVETPVGDRNVLEVLERRGLSLGGEQSGHIIFRDLATTGDGLLTGLAVLDLLIRTGRFLSDLTRTAMVKVPQVLRSVRVGHRPSDLLTRLEDTIAAEEAALAGEGRVLVRSSGTEPVVRVMVEAPSRSQAEEAADRLVAAVEDAGATHP